ncbi:MAG: ATP-binding protein [Thiohalomonadales bacterium]
MKLMPKSLLARTAWVLGIGFIFMIIEPIIASMVLLNAETKISNYFELITRVKVVTKIISNTKPQDRPWLVSMLGDRLLEISWTTDKPNLQDAKFDWATSQMNAHLSKFFRDVPIQTLITGHPKTQEKQDNDKHRFILFMQIEDSSWLRFRGESPHHQQSLYANAIAILLIFLVSIYLIALLISRQIIKPLREFSAAAIKFSVDINASPLAECGPTEIVQTARAFNTMQQRISHFVSERMQIIAAISHDLRTPLTRLRLRFDGMDKLSDYDKIMSDIDDMQTMLDSTLAFAKDDSKKEVRSRVDLTSLIQTLCDDSSDAGGDIQCELQIAVEYTCGPVALKRALTNIIENALRYGNCAHIQLAADTQQITITISDQGPGIPENEQHKVFMPFYRIEKSRNKKTGGTGLGLTVAKTVISAHGGEITLNNTEGSGLKVSISLPVNL